MRRQTIRLLVASLDQCRVSFGALACLVALLVAASANADDNPKKEVRLKEPTAKQMRIARAMAAGHSYQKHVVEEKLFPEVKNRDEFADLIARLLANASHHRELENDREAFYDSTSNTIVIYNPHARDKGTCFRPRAGLKYFKNLK
jgi:hypothetical protein